MVLKPDEWGDDRRAKLIAALPLQREGTAEDVAGAVLYCVRSGFLTGQVIVIDGDRCLKA